MESKEREPEAVAAERTLEFLKNNYELFWSLSKEEQSTVLIRNEELKNMREEGGLPSPLRELYIDLMMHDELITHSRAADTSPELMQSLLRNKLALLQTILEREKSGERIVPSVKVQKVVMTCGRDPQKLQRALLDFVRSDKKKEFKHKMKRIWRKAIKQKDWVQFMIQACLQQSILLGLRSIQDFRNSVSMIECLLMSNSYP